MPAFQCSMNVLAFYFLVMWRKHLICKLPIQCCHLLANTHVNQIKWCNQLCLQKLICSHPLFTLLISNVTPPSTMIQLDFHLKFKISSQPALQPSRQKSLVQTWSASLLLCQKFTFSYIRSEFPFFNSVILNWVTLDIHRLQERDVANHLYFAKPNSWT